MLLWRKVKVVIKMIMNIFLSLFSKQVITEAPPTIGNIEDEDDLYSLVKSLYFEHGAPWREVNIFGLRDVGLMSKDVFNDYIGIAIDGKVHLFENYRYNKYDD